MEYDPSQGQNRARAPPMAMRAPPPGQRAPNIPPQYQPPPQQQQQQQQPQQFYNNNRAPSAMPPQQWVDPRYNGAAPPPQQQFPPNPQAVNMNQPPPPQQYAYSYVSPQQPGLQQGPPQQWPQGGPASPRGVASPPKPQNLLGAAWSDSASESSATLAEEELHRREAAARGMPPQQYQPYNPAQGPRPMPIQIQQQPFNKFGPQGVPTPKDDSVKKNPNIPARSYALDGEDDKTKRTNKGNTKALMTLLAEMWIFHIAVILGFTYCLSFLMPFYNNYTDTQLWNVTCYWKIGWLLPMPYTLICFFGLALPFRTPKFLYHDKLKKRRCDNFYILTVTRGNNREAVYRSWNAHKHLERLHPSVRVHVLTDEPFFFENINCYTCPKNFSTSKSKYKARALEWYRQTMRYTEHDWILHLDEESVIDDETVRRCLEFIWYEQDYHLGQGVILYNQYRYWKNWVFTVADALRVGDDLSRFHLQYTFFHRPVFGAHGSFLLLNGLVENSITWDLGSLTEDYEFAMASWRKGFKCGKIPGFIREQSPQGFMDFLKQRRRWFIGIWRLKHFLPKMWAFFWTLGIFSLYGTIISIPLSFVTSLKYDTPRWFGLCKDMTFATFVYLYLLGIFVQDVDKGKFPLLVLIHIPMTFVLQYVAVILEALSVMYGLAFPPKDFDVIKK